MGQDTSTPSWSSLPPAIQAIREAALTATSPLEPVGAPLSQREERGLFLSSRTKGGRDLPPYYLVYFLLVDLLAFPHSGRWEKVAWTVPVRYQGRLYAIEHRKLGLGIFEPNLSPSATTSTEPSAQAEADAEEIVTLVRKGTTAAEPYFEWRAEQAANGVQLNVVNNAQWLFERYMFFRDRYQALLAEAELRQKETNVDKRLLDNGGVITTTTPPSYLLRREADWNAQAAIEAFFSWTEHAFIQLAILQGRLRSGAEIAAIADADWKTKFKSALDLTDGQTKKHYDGLLALRAQIRNFMAHGAFGKRGEAFSFHSGAGAVPVLLTGRQGHRYSLTGEPAFDEGAAISLIDEFIAHLWSGAREPARSYLLSGLPTILTYVADGTYSRAMESVEDMEAFVQYLAHESDNAANMDW